MVRFDTARCEESARGVVYTLGALNQSCTTLGLAGDMCGSKSELLIHGSSSRSEPRWPTCAVLGGSGGLLWPPRRGEEIDAASAVFRLVDMLPADRGNASFIGNKTTVVAMRPYDLTTAINSSYCGMKGIRLLVVLHGPQGDLFRLGGAAAACQTIRAGAEKCGGDTIVVMAQHGLHQQIRIGELRYKGCGGVCNLPMYLDTGHVWSTGAAMLLAANALCSRTDVYGFDPPRFNELTNEERRANGWWPYHFYDEHVPGDKLTGPNQTKPGPKHSPHSFDREFGAFCKICKDGKVRIHLPTVLGAWRDNKCACREAMKIPPGRYNFSNATGNRSAPVPVLQSMAGSSTPAHGWRGMGWRGGGRRGGKRGGGKRGGGRGGGRRGVVSALDTDPWWVGG